MQNFWSGTGKMYLSASLAVLHFGNIHRQGAESPGKEKTFATSRLCGFIKKVVWLSCYSRFESCYFV